MFNISVIVYCWPHYYVHLYVMRYISSTTIEVHIQRVIITIYFFISYEFWFRYKPSVAVEVYSTELLNLRDLYTAYGLQVGVSHDILCAPMTKDVFCCVRVILYLILWMYNIFRCHNATSWEENSIQVDIEATGHYCFDTFNKL